jgi:hypothetical protein
MESKPTNEPKQAMEPDAVPLFSIKAAIIVVVALAAVAGLLYLAYSLGNPRRYISNLRISVDNVVAREEKSAKTDEVIRRWVEVVGTIENIGDRDVRNVAFEVLLKNDKGKTVGVHRQELRRWSENFSVGANNSITFNLEITPVSDEWKAEKTQARILDLNFD